MCSGAEAVESAVKIARKWAYVKKGVPTGNAWVLTTDRCYHGVTLATMPLSNVISQSQSFVRFKNVFSTFAASPIPCAAALAALDVLEHEKFSARAQWLGEVFTKTIDELGPPNILEHRGRGRGLFQCIVLDESTPGVTGRRVAALSALRGVLIGNTANRLRFSPRLTVSEEDLVKAVKIIDQAIRDVSTLGDIPRWCVHQLSGVVCGSNIYIWRI